MCRCERNAARPVFGGHQSQKPARMHVHTSGPIHRRPGFLGQAPRLDTHRASKEKRKQQAGCIFALAHPRRATRLQKKGGGARGNAGSAGGRAEPTTPPTAHARRVASAWRSRGHILRRGVSRARTWGGRTRPRTDQLPGPCRATAARLGVARPKRTYAS